MPYLVLLRMVSIVALATVTTPFTHGFRVRAQAAESTEDLALAEVLLKGLESPGTPGFTRVAWDLKLTKDLTAEYGGEGDLLVRPGQYVAHMTYAKVSEKQDVKVEIIEGLETR
ncbi:MAG: hypothetical protein GEU99_25680 [Luteitalea sp.]|nr:hypothetical protein [Luteitalea sp.]